LRAEKKRKRSTKEDWEEIHSFIESAKTLVPTGGVFEQEFDGFNVTYSGYWTRYRVVDDPIKCQLPEDTSEITELPDCAMNCWKLLMFRRKPEDVEASVKLLLPLLKSGEIKCFKHNGDSQIANLSNESFVIVIYTWGIEERDTLKAKLHSIGFTSIPYRRGCKMFESKFGHWKQWFKE
jgi:hypothetical protein